MGRVFVTDKHFQSSLIFSSEMKSPLKQWVLLLDEFLPHLEMSDLDENACQCETVCLWKNTKSFHFPSTFTLARVCCENAHNRGNGYTKESLLKVKDQYS